MTDLNHELAEIQKQLQQAYADQREAKNTDAWWAAQRQILILRPQQERILDQLQSGKSK